MTDNFLEWMLTQETKQKTLVEIGTGNSLHYWSMFFNRVIGYDNNEEWIAEVRNQTQSKPNVSVKKFDNNIFASEEFKEDISSADYIIIDNDPSYLPRELFAQYIVRNKKKDAVVILDNGITNPLAYMLLFDKFYMVDFPNEETVTTVFFKEKP